MRWVKVARELGEYAENSASTQSVPRKLWPSNLGKLEQRGETVVGLYSFASASGTTVGPEGTRLSGVGGLDLFREGGTVPIKADRWLLAKTSSGEYYQKGPYKDVPHGHHSTGLPPWANRQR